MLVLVYLHTSGLDFFNRGLNHVAGGVLPLRLGFNWSVVGN